MEATAHIDLSAILMLGVLACYAAGFGLHLAFGKRFAGLGWLLPLIAAVCGIGAWLSWEESVQISWEWLSMGGKPLFLGIRIDLVAVRMMAMVTGITALVHVFSGEYMHGEKAIPRYWAFLSLFAFAMTLVVLASDLLLTFIGWELVGLASYFLIGFYNQTEKAAKGSQKAFIMNRIGDAGFMLALMTLFFVTGSFTLDPSSATALSSGGWMTIVGLGLMAAAFGKSAQFPFQTWLPDAMAGPTPVSSLMHAATMVAAGVYLLYRYAAFLMPFHLDMLSVVGALTAFMAAYSALTQTDIKRVLAYSTVSQLGLMMMGIGTGAEGYAFFHLLTHAFFKCGLFLSAGTVIHLLHHASHQAHLPFDVQDMRWMGGLGRKMPWVAGLYVVFAASLAGLPLFSGFISKDGLIGAAWVWAEHGGGWHWLVPVMAIVASGMTAFYVGRQGMLIFAGKNRIALQHGNEGFLEHLPKPKWTLLLPMMILAIFSFWFFWAPSNPVHSYDPLLAHAPHAPAWMPFVMGFVAITGIGFGIFFYRNGPRSSVFNKWFLEVSLQHFFLDKFLDWLARSVGLTFGRWMALLDAHVVDGLVWFFASMVIRDKEKTSLSSIGNWLDRNVVDRAVSLAAEGTVAMGSSMRSMQSGKLQRYLIMTLAVFMALVLLLIYLVKFS